jgi:hypothetical protein
LLAIRKVSTLVRVHRGLGSVLEHDSSANMATMTPNSLTVPIKAMGLLRFRAIKQMKPFFRQSYSRVPCGCPVAQRGRGTGCPITSRRAGIACVSVSSRLRRCDGTLQLPADKVFTKISAARIGSLLARAYLPNDVTLTVNTFSLTQEQSSSLSTLEPAPHRCSVGLGSLLANLRASGYSPEQVDEIYVTTCTRTT